MPTADGVPWRAGMEEFKIMIILLFKHVPNLNQITAGSAKSETLQMLEVLNKNRQCWRDMCRKELQMEGQGRPGSISGRGSNKVCFRKMTSDQN